MWEHNCTSKPAPAYWGAAGRTKCCSVLGKSQCVWVPARLPPDIGKITSVQAGWALPLDKHSLLGLQKWVPGPQPVSPQEGDLAKMLRVFSLEHPSPLSGTKGEARRGQEAGRPHVCTSAQQFPAPRVVLSLH